MAKCNINNPCMGKYGKCIDVKFVNECNGKCEFCIEQNGYRPVFNLSKMIESTIKLEDYDKVLILGGEPMLRMDALVAFLIAIRPYKKEIYLTTNGSKMNAENIRRIAPYLDGINVSIHSYTLLRSEEVTGVQLRMHILMDAIAEAKKYGVDCRMNCNIVKGHVDDYEKLKATIRFAKNLGFSSIRFAELQGCDKLFADIPFGTDDPYTTGCEETIGDIIPVTFRYTCGIVNKLKPMPEIESDRHNVPECLTPRVIYPNGEISIGWKVVEEPKIKPKVFKYEGVRITIEAEPGASTLHIKSALVKTVNEYAAESRYEYYGTRREIFKHQESVSSMSCHGTTRGCH